MNGSYLLDTNIVIALFADEPETTGRLAPAEQVFLPSIAIGELCCGVRKSGKSAQNLERIDQLAASSAVLGSDTDTARHYGDVKNKLRLKGRPLPENDVWIAALATQHDLTLATRDEHFRDVEGLKTVRW